MNTQSKSPRLPWHQRDPVEQHVEMDRHLAMLRQREREVRLAERIRREQEQQQKVGNQ